MTRAGFVALAGRPNVGKSTLVNAIVGRKVAIVSDKPQTTRRAIRGVATKPDDWQLVLTDLPGVQRPRDKLTERMQRRVESELADADAVMVVVSAQLGVGGGGDRFISEALADAKLPVVVCVNKVDTIRHQRLVEALAAAEELFPAAEIFPVSARTGKGVGPLTEHLVSLLPEGPFFFADDEISDQSAGVILAELVREQVLHRTRQEVPHAVEVVVDEIHTEPASPAGTGDREDLLTVRATILVETESQKGILIGARGSMIKALGVGARQEIERELAQRVHLDLSVRVRRAWRADDTVLDRLGIT